MALFGTGVGPIAGVCREVLPFMLALPFGGGEDSNS